MFLVIELLLLLEHLEILLLHPASQVLLPLYHLLRLGC